MSQINLVKDLRDKLAKCLAQNRDQTPFVDIKSSSYSRPGTTIKLQTLKSNIQLKNSFLNISMLYI